MLARLGAAALLAAAAILSTGASARAADMVEVKGRRISVFAPGEERAAAKRIADMGDAQIARMAEDLGLALPATRFKIFLYATEEEYAAAEEPRTHGVFRKNLAFTYARDAEVHMVFQPRPGRGGEGGDAPGMLEALAMHELAHALQYKTVASYDEQPAWLSEGVADLMSERALAGGDRSLIGTVPWYADFYHDVGEAIDIGTFVPLERLLAEGVQVDDDQDRQVRYGTSYALVRLLDDPSSDERRARFRAFLREVSQYRPGEDVANRVNVRFRELFGTPVKGGEGVASLIRLERDLVASVKRAELFPWQTLYKDVRATSDGWIIMDSFPRSSAVALSSAPPLAGRAVIRAKVVIADGPGRQADIIFGYRARNDFYKLAFGSEGFVSLLRFDGEWRRIAQATVAPELLAPGAPHDLEVAIDVARLAAKVDGRPVFKFTIRDRTFGAGRFGIGAYDGRALFRDVSGTSY
jgi:hypothetical protein